MSDQEIEKAIQAAGLTAPRLTPADIDAAIVGETYTTLPSGKVMVCELTLRNGFTVRGEAATVSKANFNEEIGRKISRENARDKVWELEGYLLQQRLSEPNVTDKMVSRFLSWKLPADFQPDGGISFKRESDYDHPEFGRTKYEPTGTNLLHAGQARDMLNHVLGGAA